MLLNELILYMLDTNAVEFQNNFGDYSKERR